MLSPIAPLFVPYFLFPLCFICVILCLWRAVQNEVWKVWARQNGTKHKSRANRQDTDFWGRKAEPTSVLAWFQMYNAAAICDRSVDLWPPLLNPLCYSLSSDHVSVTLLRQDRALLAAGYFMGNSHSRPFCFFRGGLCWLTLYHFIDINPFRFFLLLYSPPAPTWCLFPKDLELWRCQAYNRPSTSTLPHAWSWSLGRLFVLTYLMDEASIGWTKKIK